MLKIGLATHRIRCPRHPDFNAAVGPDYAPTDCQRCQQMAAIWYHHSAIIAILKGIRSRELETRKQAAQPRLDHQLQPSLFD